jgi:hypothetical protein
MRYLAVLAAICGSCFSSWASAAPFDELSERLERFDDEDMPRQSRRTDRFASQRQTRTADAQAAPVPDSAFSKGGQLDHRRQGEGQYDSGGYENGHFDDGSVWDEPFDDCGDGCGGGWCWGGCKCRQFWGRAEYLQWWVRGSETPALVTTSPEDTSPAVAGILPAATVLFGNDRINTKGRSGGRFTLGYWFDCCDSIGIENTFLFLGDAQQGYQNGSIGSPILARPFINANTGNQDAVLVAFPGIVTGNIAVTSNSKVYGNEVNLRRALYIDGCRRIDLLAGYRFFQMSEQLGVATNTISIDPSIPITVGTTFNIFDSFHTRSQFNGGQLGINTQHYFGCWSLDLLAKVALGGMSQTVTISGNTVVTPPGGSQSSNPGGVLALPSNMGQFTRSRFAVIPEFGVNLHRQLNPCWKVNLGYTIMVVTNVVRPGDQIDLNVDPRQFPPPATSGPFTQPSFAFHDSDIWLQGLNVGLEYNY